jgi:thioredoxin 1
MNTLTSHLLKPALMTALLILLITPFAAKGQKIVDNVYHLTDQDFEKYTRNGIVLVDFWATWCPPCRLQGPIIDEIAQDIGQKAVIAKVDVDAAKITSSKYRIQYIPTIIIFSNGKPALRLTGLQQKEDLLKALDSIR